MLYAYRLANILVPHIRLELLNSHIKRFTAQISKRLKHFVKVTTMLQMMIYYCLFLFTGGSLPGRNATHLYIAPLFAFPMQALSALKVSNTIAHCRRGAFSELQIQLNRSNAVIV